MTIGLRIVFLLLFLSASLFGFSQPRKVVDDSTKQAVRFAVIRILHKDTGVVADSNGVFNIDAEPKDTIEISCNSYFSKTCIFSNMGNLVSLTPRYFTMPEVRVFKSYISKIIMLGNGVPYIKKKLWPYDESFTIAHCVNEMNTEFAETEVLPDSENLFVIKKVIFPIQKLGTVLDTFILRFYLPDSNGMPGVQIFARLIDPGSIHLKKAKAYIDLTSDKVNLPQTKKFIVSVGGFRQGANHCSTNIVLARTGFANSFTRCQLCINHNWTRVLYDLLGGTVPFSTVFAVEIEERMPRKKSNTSEL